MSRYEALLLDADQTLFDFKGAENQAICNVLKKAGLPCGQTQAWLYSSINDNFWKRFERGEILRQEIFVGRFKELLSRLGSDFSPDRMNELYFRELPMCSKLYYGAIVFLKSIKNDGYKVYLITNGATATQNSRIDLCNVRDMFDGIFISEEIGYAKPEKAFFDYVLEHIGKPDRRRVLIVGDSPTADIAGGKNAGVDTCLYSPSGEACQPEPSYIARSYDDILELLKTT